MSANTLTDEQKAAVMRALGITPVASETVVASKPRAGAPDWLIARAERKANRRALAATLRAQGISPTGEAWTKAKKAAGIASAERKAHSEFVASKK